MSHLQCPLCGKMAPLSTLDPESLELGLKAVSFKGLGRGKGFAKSEEHSILGDGEYSPALANRSLKLCRMFLEVGTLKRDDVEKELNLSARVMLVPTSNQSGSVAFYMNKISELELAREETDLREQVDYIIRESYEFTELGGIVADSEGWYIKITSKTDSLNLFLYEIMQELPNKLRDRLLQHIKVDENFEFYEYNLKNVSRKKSPMEALLDEGNTGVIREKDEMGNISEKRFERVHLYTGGNNPVSMTELKKIVSDAKNLVHDPELAIRLFEESLIKKLASRG